MNINAAAPTSWRMVASMKGERTQQAVQPHSSGSGRGIATDRLGRKPVLLAGNVTAALSILLLGFSDSYGQAGRQPAASFSSPRSRARVPRPRLSSPCLCATSN